MRFNPPPNWPKPPEGWVPSAEWSPDPSWPPPPPGWKLWVEDDSPAAKRMKSAVTRVERSSDDVEYFGDDRAWSDDSGQAPPHDPLHAGAPAPSAQPTEVAPEDLSVRHLGRHAAIRWDDEHKYDIGTIVAVSADSATIRVVLAGLDTLISFQREVPAGGTAGPRVYVWI
jgi:hypothetical protein